MKIRWLVIALAGLSVIAVDAASAKPRKVTGKCVDRPYQFSFEHLIFGQRPQPNGCAPAVAPYGEYVGQDPDLNIRAYMMRDPGSGYSGGQVR